MKIPKFKKGMKLLKAPGPLKEKAFSLIDKEDRLDSAQVYLSRIAKKLK